MEAAKAARAEDLARQAKVRIEEKLYTLTELAEEQQKECDELTAKEKQAKADAKKAKEQKKQQELDEQLKKQNAEHNQKLYEAAKQKSIDNYQTSSAPKSLKSKKKKK